MKYILWTILLSFSQVYAETEVSQEYVNFLTKKAIADFEKGVELYNAEKGPNDPVLKHKNENYGFTVKKNIVHFSIADYLADKIYVNNRLTKRSILLSSNKVTWVDLFISSAVAEEGNMDAESTKIILTALGAFNKKLEDIGLTCFGSCVDTRRKSNLEKIRATVKTQKNECEEQLRTQENSLSSFSRHNQVSALHSVLDPQFRGVKAFYQKLADVNAAAVKDFMKDKLAVDKKYNDCVGVMAAGTMADTQQDKMVKGANVARAGGLVTSEIEAATTKAKEVCIELDELKSCLMSIEKNVGAINTIKRERKVGGQSDEESLPQSRGNVLSR